MLNAGIVRRDASGRLVTTDPGQPTHFNGGTPVGNQGGMRVVGIGTSINGGLRYDNDGNLNVANGGIIAGYVQGGLPVDATGRLCVDFDGVVTGYNAGIPFDASGRVAVTTPIAPSNFFAFSNAFAIAFDTEAAPP